MSTILQRRLQLILVLAISVAAAGPGEDERGGCAPTDYAPEVLTLRVEPEAKSAGIASVARDKAASMVRLDAITAAGGDWTKVQAGRIVGWVRTKDVECRLTLEQARTAVGPEASRVVEALKAGDFSRLAQYAHPVKGVRFSPHATVDLSADQVMKASQLAPAFQSPAVRIWGADDGSGAPMRLSFAGYYRKFIYDRDFATAPRIAFNAQGDGSNKAWEAYPGAVIVEYQFPESGKKNMEALRLVFSEHRGKWYLCGIIHDAWTI